jgi:DNA polymerase I-like protein with 3'-5' exonuclease and polymerase domains
MEVSAKNLDEQRREALVSVLTKIYELGFRGWVVDANPEGLRLLNTPQEAAKLGSATLFLTNSGSEREQRLHNSYKDLQIKAFQGIAKEIGLSAQQLLSRNASDPIGYAKLYGALLDRLLRDRDANIDCLKSNLLQLESKILQSERECQERLKEIRKRDEMVENLQEEVKRLREEMEHWRSEANLSTLARMKRKLKSLIMSRDSE